MIVLIDNYDSFTYNLVQRLGEIDPAIHLAVYRNDQVSLDEIADQGPTHLIVSPGPCTPREAGISCGAILRFGPQIPVLGVCLGHQSIAFAHGAEIVRADRLMHGKTDMIHHNEQGLFAGLDNPFQATRYHSLIVKPETLSDDFEITAWCNAPDGTREIMGIRHRKLPLHGLQFHPESFLTPSGTQILKRFIELPSPQQTKNVGQAPRA